MAQNKYRYRSARGTLPKHAVAKQRTVYRRPSSRRSMFLPICMLFIIDAIAALMLGWFTGRTGLLADSILPFHILMPFTISFPSLTESSLPFARPALVPSSSFVRGEAVVVNDSFQRPNQIAWGIASTGQHWTVTGNPSNAFAIQDQAGEIDAARGTFTALLNPRLSNIDVVVDFSVGQFSSGTTIGVVLRWKDASHWYKFFWDGSELKIIKRNGAQIISLGTAPFSAEPGKRYELRFIARGTTLLAKVWPFDHQEPADWQISTSDRSTSWFIGYGGLQILLHSDHKITTEIFQYSERSVPN